MDLDDMLALEDEAAQRWEDSMINKCPNCGEQMIDKHSVIYSNYKHCPFCKKNFQKRE
jgi:uncharacterized CHY-type Zn-finger protein